METAGKSPTELPEPNFHNESVVRILMAAAQTRASLGNISAHVRNDTKCRIARTRMLLQATGVIFDY